MIASLTGLDLATAVAWERALLLLLPVLLAAGLTLGLRPTPREASAAMLAFLWQVPVLLALNLLAGQAGWWSFPDAGGARVLGLPVDIWVGWAFLWGPVAALLERRMGLPALLAAAALLDAVAMPLLDSVDLAPGWFAGEPVFLAFGLLPGLLLARWTRRDIRPLARTLVHAAGWGLYLLFALPAVALAVEGRDWTASLHLPAGPAGWLGAAVTVLCLLAGAAAAFEFATVGHGTPVPVDPPKRVVMSGPYAYVANPMQVTSAAVMALQTVHHGSPALACVTAAFLLFDSVYAAHYNRVHIARAMPRDWAAYKAAVPDWRIRWRPYRPGTPLVVARTGDEGRRTVAGGLRLDAGIALRRRRAAGMSRLAFTCAETGIRARGVAALSRILERRSLPWAVLAWTMRMPLVLPLLQGATCVAILAAALGRGGGIAPHRPPLAAG
ncbi:hypothetical protein [Methylobacterium nonmethylotrophicum]|uniref:Phospholipid methyltransferase n=1 Tax=Methylobacterium nonmethylotrophicum TaxID=1141884 RepID=A0A4Z0NQK2_9HYPH|nr:hypothetical protein [Methylobacterium nonmethylotrophicum]TGD99029.1 hypothetical protein EU555_14080 [Methylobacterium nonmethylotrophicum]